jgi:hypothetical protein
MALEAFLLVLYLGKNFLVLGLHVLMGDWQFPEFDEVFEALLGFAVVDEEALEDMVSMLVQISSSGVRLLVIRPRRVS